MDLPAIGRQSADRHALQVAVIMCMACHHSAGGCAGEYSMVGGVKVKAYRGMGSLAAMTKGSEARYHSDTQALKIAQGVAGTVVDKGSVRYSSRLQLMCDTSKHKQGAAW